MADRKISDLTALTTPASGDYLPIVDISEVAAASKNKRITIEELMRGAPDGTAAAPSIAFESDPNTGIYSPGADQLAISTNGTGRLFVDASGRLGLGTSAPAKLLDLSSNSTTSLQLSNTDTILDLGQITGEILFQQSDATAGGTGISAAIKARSSNRPDTGSYFGNSADLGFFVSGSVSGAASDNASLEALTIRAAGNVGIGTSSPRGDLEISNSITYGASSGKSIYFGANNVGSAVNDGAALAWKFAVTGNQNGQNLSIASVQRSGGTNAENTRVTLTTTGLGIGTTSPQEFLTVNGAVQFGTDAIAADRTKIYESFGLILEAGEGARPIKFRTNGSERAQIDTSGRLLVGTSSTFGQFPDGLFVNASTGNTAQFGRFTNDIFGGNLTFYHGRGGAPGTRGIVQNNDFLGYVDFIGDDGVTLNSVGARISAVVDGTPGTDDMPGRLVFSTTADGADTPTERLRITSAGVLQVADAGNITVGTTTGTKIGTATTQKLGFYNSTPVVQPAAVTDATDAVDVITQLNDLLAKLRTLGIIAT